MKKRVERRTDFLDFVQNGFDSFVTFFLRQNPLETDRITGFAQNRLGHTRPDAWPVHLPNWSGYATEFQSDRVFEYVLKHLKLP